MKHFGLFLVALALFASCTSVPAVSAPREDQSQRNGDTRVYTVILGEDLKTEIARQYAINSFVKEKGYNSYNAVLDQTKSFLGSTTYYYTIIMPGSTPVEDMEEIRVVDSEKVGNGVLASLLAGGALFLFIMLGGLR